MKRLSLITLLLLFCTAASAAGPGERPILRFGVEWGYGSGFYRYWNLNYMDPVVGYRVWDEDHEFAPSLNAYALLEAGADLLPRFNLAFAGGIMGIAPGRRVVPLILKTTFFFRDSASDGPFARACGGLGFPDFFSRPPIHFASLGGGWRLALNGLWDIDFIGSVRFCSDNPPIKDEDGTIISESSIRRNTAIYCSFELGIAISF